MNTLDALKRPFPHGTRARYVQKCRCRRCRKANREYAAKKLKEKRQLALVLPQPWKKPIIGFLKDGSKVTIRMKPHCVGPDGKGCGKKIRKDKRPRLCDECLAKLGADPLVSPERARQHIHELAAKGIGRRTVIAASGVGCAIVEAIRKGKRPHIRLSTERAILAVDESCRGDASLVPAGPTWALIKDLTKRAGLSKAAIAARLGFLAPAVQFRKEQIHLKTAHAVAKLHKKVFAELEEDPGRLAKDANKLIRQILKEDGVTPRILARKLGWPNLKLKLYKGCVSTQVYQELEAAHLFFTGGPAVKEVELCTSCGLKHDKASRLERLRKALPITAEEVRARWPCVYTPGQGTDARVSRDLRDIGARVIEGLLGSATALWGIPTKMGSPTLPETIEGASVDACSSSSAPSSASDSPSEPSASSSSSSPSEAQPSSGPVSENM